MLFIKGRKREGDGRRERNDAYKVVEDRPKDRKAGRYCILQDENTGKHGWMLGRMNG